MARDTAGSRERLLDTAVELFADRGYRATTVGDIEAAAGFSPRAGAFYRHFAGKEEAFRAALDRWVDEVATFPGSVGELLPLDDVRAELTVVARGTMALLRRQRALFRFLHRDGEDFPELVARVHEQLVSRGYTQMTTFVSTRLPPPPLAKDRLAALAAVALSPLVHYCQDQALYGTPPADVEEDLFVQAWVDLWAGWFEHGQTAPASPAPRTDRRP